MSVRTQSEYEHFSLEKQQNQVTFNLKKIILAYEYYTEDQLALDF